MSSAEQQRQWREANPERSIEHNRRWRAANFEQSAEATKRWRKANKDRVDAIKLERGCEWPGGCNVAYPEVFAEILEFDHTGDDKVASIGNLRNGRWSAIEAEIAKCRVLCVYHHKVATHKGDE